MARIILVFGYPGNGKSTLAGALHGHHGFERLTVDTIYTNFIHAHYSTHAPANLHEAIVDHYVRWFSQDHVRRALWHNHLLELIIQASDSHAKVVVDGYLLGDCRTFLDHSLRAAGRVVVHVRAEQFNYMQVEPGLTTEEVAELGGS